MKKEYKPTGYNSVSAYFIINGAQKFIDLMKAIFEAKELRRYERTDGSIMHAELQIDDSVIMLGAASAEFQPTTCWMHVYVPDAKAIYEKALSLGCEGIEPPKNKEGDPDTRATFKDFAGNMWSVGTQNS
jgi:PhnB protein